MFLAPFPIAEADDCIHPELDRVSIPCLATLWLAGKRSVAKLSKVASLASSRRTQVKPPWGKREVRGIQPSEVQE